MRIPLKILGIVLKALGVILVLVGIALFWGLQRVDYLPYFESDYYGRTRGRLDSLSTQLVLGKGKPLLGFGKVSITPTLGDGEDDPRAGVFTSIPLAGYGDREGVAAIGIHDSLFVKAVAIRVQNKLMVLIGADILVIPPELSAGVSRRVQEKTGVTRQQLFFSATHTHSGVGAWAKGWVGEQFAGEPNAKVMEWLISRFAEAVIEAIVDLKPGSMGSGSFLAPDLVSNRLVGEKGNKNSEFVYLLAQQDNGAKVLIGTFDAHSTTLGGSNMYFSGDYPGYWQRKLEHSGIEMAQFMAGSMGSHSPNSRGEEFEKARFMGEILADSVIDLLGETTVKDSIGLEFMSLETDLPEYHVRITDHLRMHPRLAARLFPPPGEVYFQVARIGDLMWATAPADFSGEMTLRFKDSMTKEGYKAVVSSFNGSYVGYIIPEKYYHYDSYESRLMSWYGPYMGPYGNELIHRMMRKLTILY